MLQLDLRKELKLYYSSSSKKVTRVDVPCFNFLMIDGSIEKGMEPGTSPGFEKAMQALYSAAYTLKFMLKKRKEDALDYPVMPLEGLWWVEDDQFDLKRKDNWLYRLMIVQPEQITGSLLMEALSQIRGKKGDQPAFARLRLEEWREGDCVQILHIGPYATEPATMEKMDEFIRENRYKKCGMHHEIYLGNPMRADPKKLKTILRHPVSRI